MESGSVSQQNTQYKSIQREANPWNIWFQFIIWFLKHCSTWGSCFHYLGGWRVIQSSFKIKGCFVASPRWKVYWTCLKCIQYGERMPGLLHFAVAVLCLGSLQQQWPNHACWNRAFSLLETKRITFLSKENGLQLRIGKSSHWFQGA